MTDNLLIIIIASIVAIHFIIGFGWVFRKMYGNDKTSVKTDENKIKDNDQTSQPQ